MATRKTTVLILSTMRSGSTLLKALLASAPDVSDLPEVDFQKFKGEAAERKVADLSPKPIVLLKRPAWFNELTSYPRWPNVNNLKKIVLVRDVYENAVSLRNMAFRFFPFQPKWGFNRFIAETYWGQINSRLWRFAESDEENTRLVRYEDLLRDPIHVTQSLFRFIGSEMKEGTRRYNSPRAYQWAWGKDDGSDNIKSLEVQKPKLTRYTNPYLLRIIQGSKPIQQLREKLGYLNSVG